jgi:hypothetical protein
MAVTEQDIDELQRNVAHLELDDELLQMYEAQARKVLGDDPDLSASLWRIRAKAEAARLLASTNQVRLLRAALAAQEQASDDEPASYPGELWSDGPYKEQMRYQRDGRGGWGPW